MLVLPPIEYGIAARAKDGEAKSGDSFLVQEENERIVIGLVDGLGHGPDAAGAADIAITALRARPRRSAPELLANCHKALAGTRGAAMAIAVFDACEATMTWIGVGNIEGRLVRSDKRGRLRQEFLVNQPGIVGYRMPSRPRPATLSLRRGDLVAFATDGLDPDFDAVLRTEPPPQVLADYILARCGRRSDDALILVARWLGPNAGP